MFLEKIFTNRTVWLTAVASLILVMLLAAPFTAMAQGEPCCDDHNCKTRGADPEDKCYLQSTNCVQWEWQKLCEG